MSEETLQALLDIFKVLADESRLRLIGILAVQERSVEELAAMLKLKPPTVSHHLAKLKEANLVHMRTDGNVHLYALNAEALQTLSRELLSAKKVASLADDVSAEAWERKILKDSFAGEELKRIPASHKKRLVVLRWLVDRFEPDTRYPEKQVNEMLKRHHPDYA